MRESTTMKKCNNIDIANIIIFSIVLILLLFSNNTITRLGALALLLTVTSHWFMRHDSKEIKKFKSDKNRLVIMLMSVGALLNTGTLLIASVLNKIDWLLLIIGTFFIIFALFVLWEMLKWIDDS